MSLREITEYEMKSQGVVSLPTRPTSPREFGGRGYTPTELKEAFDRLPRLVAERYNELIDYITDGSYLGEIPYGDGTTLLAHLDNMTERLLTTETEIDALTQASETQGDMVVVQEGRLTSCEERVDILEREVALTRAIQMGSFLSVVETEDTYLYRQTAAGLPLVNGVATSVCKVAGATVKDNENSPHGIKHATFAGIKSTGTNIADLSALDGLAKFGVQVTACGNVVSFSGVPTSIYRTFYATPLSEIGEVGKTYVFAQSQYFTSDADKNAVYWQIKTPEGANVSASRSTPFSVTITEENKNNILSIIIGKYVYTEDNSFNTTILFQCCEQGQEDISFAPAVPVELGEWDDIDVARRKIVRQTETVVFDGTEDWTIDGLLDGNYAMTVALTAPSDTAYNHAMLCGGFETGGELTESTDGVPRPIDQHCMLLNNHFTLTDVRYRSADEWKAHLAAMYAAGTPLTIAYKREAATEDDIAIPTSYLVWRRGGETIVGNNVPCTVSQQYYVIGTGEVTA